MFSVLIFLKVFSMFFSCVFLFNLILNEIVSILNINGFFSFFNKSQTVMSSYACYMCSFAATVRLTVK